MKTRNAFALRGLYHACTVYVHDNEVEFVPDFAAGNSVNPDHASAAVEAALLRYIGRLPINLGDETLSFLLLIMHFFPEVL